MNWDKVVRVAEPATAAVTISEAKARLGITISDDDSILLDMIRGVCDMIEGPHGYGIALTSQQYDIYYDSFGTELEIPLTPIISVDSVKYELSGTQTVDSAEYEVDLLSGKIRTLSGYSWPSTDTVYNPVVVRATVGYSTVPQVLKDAVLLIVGHRYENREETSVIDLNIIPMGARYILEQYRRNRFG